MLSVNLKQNDNCRKYTNFEHNDYNYSSASKSKKIGVGVASFCIPGLGQVINNDIPKGIAFFLGSVCNILLFFKMKRNNLMGTICRLGIGIWAAKDAHDNAR